MKESGKSPFGQLPLLKDGGTWVGQSIAIVNYIGKKAGARFYSMPLFIHT
jgi:glutathione S-transferase